VPFSQLSCYKHDDWYDRYCIDTCKRLICEYCYKDQDLGGCHEHTYRTFDGDFKLSEEYAASILVDGLEGLLKCRAANLRFHQSIAVATEGLGHCLVVGVGVSVGVETCSGAGGVVVVYCCGAESFSFPFCVTFIAEINERRVQSIHKLQSDIGLLKAGVLAHASQHIADIQFVSNSVLKEVKLHQEQLIMTTECVESMARLCDRVVQDSSSASIMSNQSKVASAAIRKWCASESSLCTDVATCLIHWIELS
jgi:hypothetical protein